MDRATGQLKRLVSGVNLGWAIWSTIGGGYFVMAGHAFGDETVWHIFGKLMHGYLIVGWSLIACGIISLISVGVRCLGKLAAILCTVWCLSVAATLVFSTPTNGTDADLWLYTWFLVICAFTCMMRWALLVLEPHLAR